LSKTYLKRMSKTICFLDCLRQSQGILYLGIGYPGTRYLLEGEHHGDQAPDQRSLRGALGDRQTQEVSASGHLTEQ